MECSAVECSRGLAIVPGDVYQVCMYFTEGRRQEAKVYLREAYIYI